MKKLKDMKIIFSNGYGSGIEFYYGMKTNLDGWIYEWVFILALMKSLNMDEVN